MIVMANADNLCSFSVALIQPECVVYNECVSRE